MKQDTALPAVLPGEGLWRHALFGAVLAAAGLPIYMHAPVFFAQEHGVSLAALGGVLFALRLIDLVQDPILGWLADVAGTCRGLAAAGAAVILGGAMVALFAVPPPFAPLAWFALCLTALFSAFSFLWILLYAVGAARGEALGEGGPLRLAAWREAGTLGGICLATIAPTMLAATGAEAPFASFALAFCGVLLVAAVAMAPEWRRPLAGIPGHGLRSMLADPPIRRLLLLGLVNAAPVAVTASTFLFFVEARLGAPDAAGPLLLAFFLASACTAPLWSRAALRFGARRTLGLAMALGILSFSGAALLGPGDLAIFAVICLASGAAIGADFAILPALFSHAVARSGGGAGQAFGLWNFCAKLSLALAAGLALPALGAAGFDAAAGAVNTADALFTLTLVYAGLPSLLKAAALALLFFLPIDEA